MTQRLSTFFAVLSLGCWLAVVAVAVLVVVSRVRPVGGAVALLAGIRASALWLAWLVAAVATAGSLYYSLGAHFQPCELCWYQRICIYPFTVVLFIAAVRRDTSVWRYVLPITGVGAVVAGYHSQLQAFPEQSTFCSAVNPCTTRYVWEFGFVSLPLMALAALVFIATMMLVVRGSEPGLADDEVETDVVR
jgi:disulfide bond formation protein DsbB